MNEVKDRLIIKEKIENLREKLNNYIIKNVECKDIEKNKDILAASEELDNVIVDYIKNFNQEIWSILFEIYRKTQFYFIKSERFLFLMGVSLTLYCKKYQILKQCK